MLSILLELWSKSSDSLALSLFDVRSYPQIWQTCSAVFFLHRMKALPAFILIDLHFHVSFLFTKNAKTEGRRLQSTLASVSTRYPLIAFCSVAFKSQLYMCLMRTFISLHGFGESENATCLYLNWFISLMVTPNIIGLVSTPSSLFLLLGTNSPMGLPLCPHQASVFSLL